jgi:hypothetical protein
VTDPTERLLQNIRSALAARTLTRLEPIARIEAALAAYKRAVEGQVVSEFVSQHSLPSQHLAGDRKATAEALLALVGALPELAGRSDGAAPTSSSRVPGDPQASEMVESSSAPVPSVASASPAGSSADSSAEASEATEPARIQPVAIAGRERAAGSGGRARPG